MRVPRGILIAIGVSPIAALLALLVWGVFRERVNPGSLAVFDSTGEVAVRPRPMPEFALDLYDGKEFRSQDVQGKLVMVDFWASWCPPCRAEAPSLERVWQHYRSRGDVAFVGVSVWSQDQDALEFLSLSGSSYTIGKDPRGRLAVEFGVTGIPEKYFVSPQGYILKKFVGPMDETRLRRVIDELLGL